VPAVGDGGAEAALQFLQRQIGRDTQVEHRKRCRGSLERAP
jgi:hypothetical protein